MVKKAFIDAQGLATGEPRQVGGRWVRWLPWCTIGAFTALWAARWPTFPLLLDPYYHLLVARQVVDAGGPIAYEWWENAPVGRPHLYPPAIHLILAGLLAVGCSPIVAIRLLTCLIVPCTLVTLYLGMRKVSTPEAAVAALFMALVPFSWVLQLSHGLASGLATMEIMWLVVSLSRRRWIAAGCLLALLFYTHLGLPWVALATMGGAVVLRGITAHRTVLWSIGLGVLLGLPWLWHVASHAGLLRVVSRYENQSLEVNLTLYLLAAFGAWRARADAGAGRLFLSLWLGFGLMAYPFLFRWLSGEGLLPVVLLAGYGLAGLAQQLAAARRRPAAQWLVIVGLSGLVAASPTVLWSRPVATQIERLPAPPQNLSGAPGAGPAVITGAQEQPAGVRLLWLDATPFHVLNWPATQRKAQDLQLYNPHTADVAGLVTSLTRPGQILWSNAPYVGGLLAALSHRPTSSAMFYEVPSGSAFEPLAAAHLIVWFKIGPFPGVPELGDVIQRYRLTMAGETELAWLFRHPGASELAHPPNAAVPWWLAFVLSCGLIGFILWDVRRTPDGPHQEQDGKAQRNLHQR